MAYYRNLLLARDRIQTTLLRNAHSGMNYLLATSLPSFDQPYIFDLYGTGQDSIWLMKRRWGLFETGISRAMQGSHQQMLASLIAAQPDSTSRATLYLTDEKRSLTLAGEARLSGICYLPEAGIRTTYLEGKGFTGIQPDTKSIRHSSSQMPGLPEQIREQLRAQQDGYGTALPFQHLTSPLQRSFADPTLVFSTQTSTGIAGNLRGNIVLHSTETLVLTTASQLENVIVLARKIIVEAGFQGQVQLFAQDTLEVQSGARLLYPSVTSVHPSDGHKGLLKIAPQAIVEGIVLVSTAGTDESLISLFRNHLKVEKGAQIIGHVYCDGLTTFAGILYGSLVSRRMILQTPSALYENHLMDAELCVDKRPHTFLTSPLLAQTPKQILMWLH